MIDQQIDAATEWWAKTLTNPKFDNGDPSPTGGMATVLATLGRQPATGGQREKFRAALKTRIAEDSADGRAFVLACDYGPDYRLGEAMHEAGIAQSNAPWKTVMHLLPDGTVTVRCGYGAPQQILREPDPS